MMQRPYGDLSLNDFKSILTITVIRVGTPLMCPGMNRNGFIASIIGPTTPRGDPGSDEERRKGLANCQAPELSMAKAILTVVD